MDATLTGLDRLKAKFDMLPEVVRKAIEDQNQDNAREFMSRVAQIVPYDPEDNRTIHLAATLTKEKGDVPGSVRVSIGGDEAPYPAHLEYGHLFKDGHYAPPKPFWWPTWRLMRKTFRDRLSRKVRLAIKTYVGGINW